jgi:hypothetical protein
MSSVQKNAAPSPYFSSFAVHLAFMCWQKTRIEFSLVAIVRGSMIISGRVLEAIAEFWINRVCRRVCVGGSRSCATRASIVISLAVQAVQRELVSKCDFPVRREKTGNFKQNRGFRATGVAKNSNSSVC